MAVVNLSLLFGAGLAVIPVVLHLILRQQPKRVVFPAIRFVKQRHEANRRELQLRHWLLLLLRCALIALGALVLARPSVASAAIGNWMIVALLLAIAVFSGVAAAVARTRDAGRWLVSGLGAVAGGLLLASLLMGAATLAGSRNLMAGDQQAPIAAALLVDTAPRMEYQFQNQARLEAAREMAAWLLKQFPEESSLAVLDSRPGPPFFAVDRAAAESMLERLRSTGTPEDLPSVIERGIDLVATKNESRREVYVFTDLTRAAWPEEAATRLQAKLDEHPDVLLYVIDVGAEQPRNLSLGDLELSSETLVRSSDLTVRTSLLAHGYSGPAVVELLVERPDPTRPVLVDGKPLLPEAEVRDRRTVAVESNAAQQISFRIRGWERGTQQGVVRVSTPDGLQLDNTRFFTVDVREAWPVLLVAPPQVNTSLLLETLAPLELRESGAARFDCVVLPQGDLSNETLAGYAVVALLNPTPLPPDQWEQLGQYVERGGNLLLALGHHAQEMKSFNEPAAQRLLGGKLLRVWRAADRELFLNPLRFDHPSLAIFREQASGVPWQELPVFRHWVLEDGQDSSAVLPFSNGKPAILERQLGSGRVVIATTPLSEEARPAGRAPWNELLTGENAWPSFVFTNELMRYLVSGGESRLNYTAGETATLRNDATQDPERYQLFPPSDEPQEVISREGVLSIAFTEQPGAYRLKGDRGGPVIRGFAVNLPQAASDLTRLSREDLTRWLGREQFRFARSREDIVLEVGEARAGREFYPYLLIALAVVLGLEQTLANRFYRSQEKSSAVSE